MNISSELEINFFSKITDSKLQDPVRFGLTLLNNGCYCLSSFNDYGLLHNTLSKWLLEYTKSQSLADSKKSYNDFLSERTQKNQIQATVEIFSFSNPKENVSSISLESTRSNDTESTQNLDCKLESYIAKYYKRVNIDSESHVSNSELLNLVKNESAKLDDIQADLDLRQAKLEKKQNQDNSKKSQFQLTLVEVNFERARLAEKQHQLHTKKVEFYDEKNRLDRMYTICFVPGILEEMQKKFDVFQAEFDVLQVELDDKRSSLDSEQKNIDTEVSGLNDTQVELNDRRAELDTKQAELDARRVELDVALAGSDAKQGELGDEQVELDIVAVKSSVVRVGAFTRYCRTQLLPFKN